MREPRILFLSKRLYMGKDLIADQYGRFREIPLELARLGHDVHGLCLSYRQRPAGQYRDGGVDWTSFDLGATKFPRLAEFLFRSKSLMKKIQPDIIISASDAFHAIWGHHLARSCGALSAIDLYDNFESYTGTNLPLIKQCYAHSVKNADLVSCISAPLAELVAERYGRSRTTILLENGVNKRQFHPRPMNLARARLGLPEHARIFGLAGALTRNRDIETVFAAADIVAATQPDIHIAVAGQRDSGIIWPKHATVHDFGMLDHNVIPDFICALDTVVVPNLAGLFGSYCHPQKAVEAAACERPFIAARTGTMAKLMADRPHVLYKPGNANDLARTILANLDRPAPVIPVYDWSEIAGRLSQALGDLRGLTKAGGALP